MKLPTSLADCEQWDQRDPLARTRRQFQLKPGVIYLDGNSLGAPTKASMVRARAMIEDQWGHDLIRSWNMHGWFSSWRPPR